MTDNEHQTSNIQHRKRDFLSASAGRKSIWIFILV
jgi:hypothetical protein